MAEEELERQQIRKRSEEKLPEAWKELLKEPHPELVKLVSEKVKELFGFVPDRETIIEFLRNSASKTQTSIAEIPETSPSKTSPRQKERSKESIPQSEYRTQVLQVIEEMGGKGKTGEIKRAVGEKMKDRFSHADKEYIKSGRMRRWEKHVEWAIWNLTKEGLLQTVQRGVKEITDKGREYLRRAKTQP
ncbi:MAG: winged helix-turn-helix domain-containing protein [Thermoplasmata archaeon]